MPVRDLLELLRRQGEALGPNSWNGTRLAKRASERFREIAVIKSRTNRFIWPTAVEGTKSRFVRFKTKDDLLNPEPNFRSPIWFGVKQVGTALVGTALIETLRAGKFEPTCLNGEPVAIKWNASVMFRSAPFRQAP